MIILLAEKGGLQQGDKILEWCGTSLVDRSFEEVCSIMDRTGDTLELLVEHASDFRMCDLLEDNNIQTLSNPIPIVNQRKNSDVAMTGLVAGELNNNVYKLSCIYFHYVRFFQKRKTTTTNHQHRLQEENFQKLRYKNLILLMFNTIKKLYYFILQT
jgi:hypothetical protein